jgi:hypothetical protein
MDEDFITIQRTRTAMNRARSIDALAILWSAIGGPEQLDTSSD